jgi:hypothetical protein
MKEKGRGGAGKGGGQGQGQGGQGRGRMGGPLAAGDIGLLVSEVRREGTTSTRRALRRAQMPEVWNRHDQAITNYPHRVGGFKNAKSRWNRAEG